MVQQVTVSTSTSCASPKNLGFCSVLQCSWDSATNKVKHAKANPLNCATDEDIDPFTVRVLSLPAGYAVSAAPDGSSYTSTATISGCDVIFTIPDNTGVWESWTVTVYDPGNSGAPTDNFGVKLKRLTGG